MMMHIEGKKIVAPNGVKGKVVKLWVKKPKLDYGGVPIEFVKIKWENGEISSISLVSATEWLKLYSKKGK